MNFEYLHLFVKDAEVWRDWFVEKLNFGPLWSQGIGELGELAVQSGRIVVLLSSARSGLAEVGQFLQTYSEGIGDVAFSVGDVGAIAARCQRLGSALSQPLQRLETPNGDLRWCRVRGWGSVWHTLIESSAPSRQLLSHGSGDTADREVLSWLGIDHAVLNVAAGELEPAVAWYETHLGFVPQQQFVIETPRSGLRSVVLKHPDGDATLPINEPTSPNSQIQEFIDLHGGAGIQHVALKTPSLIETIAALRARGLAFLSVPDSYYQQLRARAGFWHGADDWRAIARQQILVDWPPTAPQTRLLQTFTQPLFERPTFFWEFIERQTQLTAEGWQSAQGFGEGNFQALFEAIEREQQLRGSLE